MRNYVRLAALGALVTLTACPQPQPVYVASPPPYQEPPPPQPPPEQPPVVVHPTPPPVSGPVFDARGWTLIASASVDGRRDRDSIPVGRYAGRFDQLTMVVYDSDLLLEDFDIEFGNKTRWSPRIRHDFREGSRTRVIDLPGDNRTITRIELQYRNLAGGGRARVEIYGRDTGRRPTTPPPPAPGPVFDARGWTLLGSAQVTGRRDRDAIAVGKYAGRFDQLTMVVTDSDLDLEDFVIEFGNRTRWSPRLRHAFREGSRTRVIDLPGDDRMIRRIELQYRNLPGGGRARVEIYARDTGRRPTPPPPAPGPVFDARGWTLLGSAQVTGRRDRDVIPVGKYAGRFDQLTMVVVDSDLELEDFVVVFGNRDRWSPKIRHGFREGARTRVIDLPGDDRTIVKIELQYRNLPGGGKARVEVYGRDTGRRPTPPPPAPGPVFDARGWTLLGSAQVTGRRDRDAIPVGKYAGRFDQLTMVVTDSDLDLEDFVVVFGNKERWSPKLRHGFREGSRTRVIYLPGDDRTIVKIELQYRNLPGGGKARVEVYGRDTGRRPPPRPDPRPGQPPPPPPSSGDIDLKGYHLIATATVDGKRDADAIPIQKGKPYQSIVLRATGSDLELIDFVVIFANNERFAPGTKVVFREGSRSRQIDLPGKKRNIKQIDVKYGNLPGGGRATLEVYAR